MNKIKEIGRALVMLLRGFNKLSLPIVILIAAIILGGFYYASENNKQESLERQEEARLQEARRVGQIKIGEENQRELSLQFCLDEAYNDYKKSLKYWLSTENKIGASNVLKEVEKAKENQSQDEKKCYQRYK